MSSGVPNSALAELLQTTLSNYPIDDFQTTFAYQRYEVVDRWFAKDRVQETAGVDIRRKITLDDTGTAKMIYPRAKRKVAIVDTMKEISAPWVDAMVYWSVDRKEMMRNRSPWKLIELVKHRRIQAKQSKADLLEVQAWSTPTNTNDELNARGLPYWASFADNGATGADFVGHTVRFADGTTSATKGGITYTDAKCARWQHWVDTYDGTFNLTLVNKMRLAWIKMNFKRPKNVEESSKRPFSDWRIYMSQENSVQYEALATANNDNLGPDVAPFDGDSLVFKRTPIIPIPQIGTMRVTDGGGASFDPKPIYFINHGRFYPIVHTGEWMREHGPYTDVEMPEEFTTYIDSEFQFFCDNVREACGVIHRVIPAA